MNRNRRERLLRQQAAKREVRSSYRPEQLEERALMAVGPQLVGINPNGDELLLNGDVRNVSPTELTFRFDQNQVINATTLGAIRLTRANRDGIFANGNDITIAPGFLGIGNAPNEVVMRFAEVLPDDTYRIDVLGSGAGALRNVQGEPFNNGINFRLDFRLNLAPQVVSVVPQPITRNPVTNELSQARNQIVVYFNEDDLLDNATSAENPAFYQLYFTQDSVTNTDDIFFTPSGVSYDPAANRAVLTFARDLDLLPTAAQKLASSRGTFRLRIGTREDKPAVPVAVAPPVDPGSSLATSLNLGNITRQNQIVSGAIEAQQWDVVFPGGSDEPGHRAIPRVENHLNGGGDAVSGTTIYAYNFQDVYGEDPLGNRLFNLISPAQKQRAREVFEFYSHYLGIDFIETANQGFTIVTGDLRAIDPTVPTGPGGVAGLAGGNVAIMDAAETWNDEYAGNWFQTAMHEIGHLLGLGHSYDLPALNIMGESAFQSYGTTPEPIFPGLNDILHGQHLHRPDSIDIDMYRFTVTEAGLFTAETIAERSTSGSLLDSFLRIYRADGSLVAQNDDYFSEDSLIRVRLEPGVYFVGVSSTGNDEYSPVRENSGANGTSQGAYELRLGYLPEVNSSLVDATGVALDGDGDGLPGGVFNHWFQAKAANQTIYVDRASGNPDSTTANDTGLGTLARPYQKIATALAAAKAGDVIRIVGNAGRDGNSATLQDNWAYEIGRNLFGNLRDGATFNVPKDVTVMIDAGAIIKMQNATIRIGSDPVGVNRSGAALQIMGVPGNEVVFTSAEDETIGIDFNPLSTTPEPGEWGGIVFQNDVDRSFGRFDYEKEGQFLNYVAHSTLLYGGGNVTVNSVRRVFNPIHMTDARPTVIFNTIRRSADAAMSANPDSFEESRFIAADSLRTDYQVAPFTPDYSRVGPDVHGNRIVDNTINGLFVRIDTPAGNQLERMTVAGRWNDRDIVHVVSENLLIAGTPGGPQLNLVTGALAPRTDASLVIDPGIIVKLDGARIETEIGAQLVAEGEIGSEIVFTSLEDDRFGAGGTFETSIGGSAVDRDALAGDWGGIFGGPVSNVSIDRARIAYGGGITRVEGSFAGFNAVTFYQTDIARLTRSTLEFNASGRGGQDAIDRGSRGDNDKSVIFVRGAQPIIIGNTIHSSTGPETAVISIDANSLSHFAQVDMGRSVGAVDRLPQRPENRGPLVADNVLDSNPINGMLVRGGVLTSETVWDDTDIVHVLLDEIITSNLHTYGGVQLISSGDESLVVKLRGAKAGFTATGVPLEIPDRIGGTVQVLGLPGRPVVLTSLEDDTVGAGFDRQGRPLTNTLSSGRPLSTAPAGAFQIDLNYGPVLRSRPDIVAAMEMAARTWEQLFDDPITVVIDVELSALPDGVLTTAVPETLSLAYETIRGQMQSDSTGRSNESIVSQLPTFQQLRTSILLPSDPTNPFVLSRNMTVNRANAKALGLNVPLATATASQFDPAEFRDGRIDLNLDPIGYDGSSRPVLWDYDPTDGVQPERYDIVSEAMKRIGSILGFDSRLDTVDQFMTDPTNPNPRPEIELAPLDLFRLQPGEGAKNFTTARRVMDPRVDQVFFDGGYYDSFGIGIANIGLGDIPLASGPNFGNGSLAGFWDSSFRPIGVMDDGVVVSEELVITEADRQAFDLIGYNVKGGGIAGDWRSILMETYANDRNVDIATEAESSDVVAPGTNATPDTAEYLGQLAPNGNAGDDNRRLGFEVRGLIDEVTDVDVYSFQATSATQVWLDIDRTSGALDTILELIDSDENVIVRSNDSVLEDRGTSELFVNDDFVVAAFPLSVGEDNSTDHYSTNPSDAGFRVVLPGRAGVVNTFHVRVRSAGGNVATVGSGLSNGSYVLQVRLGETDEKPGSTVRMADIRYALDGVRLRGLPRSSEFVGEVREDDSNNDSLPISRVISRSPLAADFPGPQKIGNLLQTNQGMINISGSLSSVDDVDLYLFEVAFNDTQNIQGFTDPRFADIVLDMDYADGLAGPDTNIAIYRATVGGPANSQVAVRNLVFTSSEGSDRDDLPQPLDGASLDDLTRGSAGQGDPFLGPVRLAEGFYVLAISNDGQRIGEAADQTENDNPVNPFVRVTPNENVLRLVDTTFDAPPLRTPLLPNFMTEDSAVPFHLGDVTMFVSGSGSKGSTIYTVDPFVGSQETKLGEITLTVDDPFDDGGNNGGGGGGQAGRFYFVGDIALRSDGFLFGLSLGDTDQNSGNLFKISTEDAKTTGVGAAGALQDDLIETYEPDDKAAPTQEIRVNGGDGFGVQFQGITILSNYQADKGVVVDELFAIGSHATDKFGAVPNALYRFDFVEGTQTSGNAKSDPAKDRTGVGIVGTDTAWTQIVEVGKLDTSKAGPGGNFTGLTFLGPAMTIADASKFADGTVLRFANGDDKYVMELDNNNRMSSSTAIRVPIAGGETAAQLTQLMAKAVVDAGVTAPIAVDNVLQFSNKSTILLQPQGATLAAQRMFGVTDKGGLYEILDYNSNAATAEFVTTATSLGGIVFSGLTMGPAAVENGRYLATFFATSKTGDIYAFNSAGTRLPIFYDGTSKISTGVAGLSGLAFSTLDRNLWHITDRRADDVGHGPIGPVFPSTDNKFTPSEDQIQDLVDTGVITEELAKLGQKLGAPCSNTSQSDSVCFGGQSFYFGDNNPSPAEQLNINYPGGAHGSIVSQTFDLSEYTAEDAPFLYFNYYLAAEEATLQYDPLSGLVSPMRDALRVFVADGSDANAPGQWHMVASSDPQNAEGEFLLADRGFTFDVDPDDDIDIDVQQLFYNSFVDVPRWRWNGAGWDFVGQNGVRDRFPFREEDGSEPFDSSTIDGAAWAAFPELNETAAAWRQARIDLSPFAGSSKLVLRFDFSTAASFDLGNIGGIELRAVPGAELKDGDTFQIDTQVFEFDLGYVAAVTDASRIANGAKLTYSTPANQIDVILNKGVVPGPAVTVTEPAAWADGSLIRLRANNTNVLLEVDRNNTLTNSSARALRLTGTETAEQVAQLLSTVAATGGAGTSTVTGATVRFGTNVTVLQPAPGSNVEFSLNIDARASAEEVAAQVEQAITQMSVATARVYRTGSELNFKGVSTVVLSGNGLEMVGTPGAIGLGRRIDVHRGMTAAEIAQAMQLQLAARFAAGQRDVIKVYDNMIRLFRRTVVDVGPLSVATSLPGDDWGAFSNLPGSAPANTPAYRGMNNDSQLFDYNANATLDPGDGDFELPFEGAYIDDLIIGFAGRGEATTDHRIPYSDDALSPADSTNQGDVINIYDQGVVVNPVVTTDLVQTGRYELQIRRVDPLTAGQVIDPRERLSAGVTLFAPSGGELSDGRTFTLSDTVNFVTFEYEDLATSNGVGLGHVPVVFEVGDSAATVALAIRNAINLAFQSNLLDVRAALTNGDTTGNVPVNRRINLFGSAEVLSDDAPNGIDFLLGSGTDNGNIPRGMGQVVIHSNRISDSARFGVVVEDSERDLPNYDQADSEDILQHSQFTTGDYIPQPGPVRNLSAPNAAQLTTGVVIANNVISEGNEGAIHFGGDANGIVMVAPFGIDPQGPTIEAAEGKVFRITDQHGRSALFEMEDLTQNNGVAAGNIPVNFARQGGCAVVTPAGVVDCEFRYSGVAPDLGDRLEEAIESAPIDVTIWRVQDELFIEGAVEVTGVSPGGWLEPFTYAAQRGAVPFGRIINNTLIGRGGNLTDQREVQVTGKPDPVIIDDYQDVGILVEDGASPTLLNNVVVNFQTALAADNTSKSSVVGGTLFQGNVALNRNFTNGDFAINLNDTDPLFVNFAAGNYYPAQQSRIIDSSVNSLEDRPSIASVRDAHGLARSPILAPNRDSLGQLRVDDPVVEPPDGFGLNVFKDRGALDRADFVGPNARLFSPRDNDSEGVDKNGQVNVVEIAGTILSQISLQFTDGSVQGATSGGTGVDPNTVTADRIRVTRNGVGLQQDLDYTYSFDATNSVIFLRPVAGVFSSGATYVIQLLDGITDVAGNPLQPNQPTGGVQFTIQAFVGADFGDAPLPYPTREASNGARHSITEGFFLGAGVTAESNGTPAEDALGDFADDGVVFPATIERGRTIDLGVTASQDGRLDAWIDYNQDGDWSDAGEQIFANRILVPGSNRLSVTIPNAAVIGDTFARFRFSTAGGLAPTGAAADGEVEDYGLTISGRASWQNPVNVLDVNNDGQVSGVDALRVINELNSPRVSNPETGALPQPPNPFPNTPGYLDVDGNGFVSPLDALRVINFLNSINTVPPITSSASSAAKSAAATSLVQAATSELIVAAPPVSPSVYQPLDNNAYAMALTTLYGPVANAVDAVVGSGSTDTDVLAISGTPQLSAAARFAASLVGVGSSAEGEEEEWATVDSSSQSDAVDGLWADWDSQDGLDDLLN